MKIVDLRPLWSWYLACTASRELFAAYFFTTTLIAVLLLVAQGTIGIEAMVRAIHQMGAPREAAKFVEEVVRSASSNILLVLGFSIYPFLAQTSLYRASRLWCAVLASIVILGPANLFATLHAGSWSEAQTWLTTQYFDRLPNGILTNFSELRLYYNISFWLGSLLIGLEIIRLAVPIALVWGLLATVFAPREARLVADAPGAAGSTMGSLSEFFFLGSHHARSVPAWRRLLGVALLVAAYCAVIALLWIFSNHKPLISNVFLHGSFSANLNRYCLLEAISPALARSPLIRNCIARQAAYAAGEIAAAAILATAVLGLAFLMMRLLASRLLLPSVLAFRRHDPRPPIIYLRRFDQDHAHLPSAILSPVANVFAIATGRNSLDRQLLHETQAFGPVFAVGDPRVAISPYGVPRELLGDASNWRVRVTELIGSARKIIVFGDASEGIQWEMAELFRLRREMDCIFFASPRMTREERTRFLADIVRRALGSSDAAGGTGAADFENAFCAFFDKSGDIVVLTLGEGDWAAHLVALRYALRASG